MKNYIGSFNLFRPCAKITVAPPEDVDWYCDRCQPKVQAKANSKRGRPKGRGRGRGRGKK